MADNDSLEFFIKENRKMDLWKNIISNLNEYKRKNSSECKHNLYVIL